MAIFASILFLNHSIERHSSRNLPLNDSLVPFCQGFPGSMWAVPKLDWVSQSGITLRISPDRDAIEIVTSRNAGFLIPRQWIGALQDVPTDELSKLEVWPDGSAIELEDRDIQISVHGLLTAILPGMLPSQSVAAVFANRGGQATSRAKRKSSRANGRKGGRPRKKTSIEVV
jgi:hypothetical protein